MSVPSRPGVTLQTWLAASRPRCAQLMVCSTCVLSNSLIQVVNALRRLALPVLRRWGLCCAPLFALVSMQERLPVLQSHSSLGLVIILPSGNDLLDVGDARAAMTGYPWRIKSLSTSVCFVCHGPLPALSTRPAVAAALTQRTYS